MLGRGLDVDINGIISNSNNNQRTQVLEEKGFVQSWQVSALALDEMQRSSYHLTKATISITVDKAQKKISTAGFI